MTYLNKYLSVFLTAFTSIAASAQVESQEISPKRNEIQSTSFEPPVMVDSFAVVSNSETIRPTFPLSPPGYPHTGHHTLPVMPTSEQFRLWNKANIVVYSTNDQMPGLMDMSTGAASLKQNLGRLHLTGSVIANKYWMPMQSQLYTQYGFGGTIGYELTDAVSLHAFGYYYAINPHVSPAFSPYVSTTSFGGYANIRFSEHFGSEVGVRRYINPMSGRWTTSPIVTPYFRVGKRNKIEIGLPLGELLKSAIWGNNDNPLRYRPQPPQPQQKKK